MKKTFSYEIKIGSSADELIQILNILDEWKIPVLSYKKVIK